MSPRTSALLLAACATVSLHSRAAETTPVPGVPAGASEAAPEVTVRGEPPPRSASEAVLDQRLLSAAPHENASELLSVVPGVVVTQHSGEGKAHQIFFRGFDAVHGQDVEIWAGGAPVNEVSNVHGQGYADLHFLIPEVVREIRSTPGTYDPRQGDFAVAGTLRFGLGYAEPGVTARASAGSFGARRLFLAYHPKDASPDTFGAFELATTDGFGPARASSRASGIAQVAQRLVPGVNARLLGSTYAGRFDSAGVLRLDDLEAGRVGRFDTYDAKQGGYSSRTQLVLAVEKEGDAPVVGAPDAWSIAPYVVLRTLELRSNFTGALTHPEGDSTQQLNDSTTAGLTASYRRTVPLFSSHDALEAGVMLRSDSIRQTQHRLSSMTDSVTDDEQRPGIEANLRGTQIGGYVDAELHPLRRVTLRGGVRADALSFMAEDRGGDAEGQARSSAGFRISPRGTLDLTVVRGLAALFSYGAGFRSPQIRSLGDGQATPFTSVRSYEAGVRFRDGQRFQASLALFRTELGDDLVFDPTNARNSAVPATSRTGIAASLGARPSPWLLSNTSLSFTRAVFAADGGEYREGDLVPYAPELVARSDLAFTPVLGRVAGRELRSHFGAGMSYFGRRPLPYAELGRDALLLDVSAEVRLGSVQAGLELYNLLDADWYDGEFVYASSFGGTSSLVPARHVTVGAPRTFLFSLAVFV